jgi:hypothetical protein
MPGFSASLTQNVQRLIIRRMRGGKSALTEVLTILPK